MKEIKLMNLGIRNFKGVKDFVLEVNGDDLNVFGDNATGKTTIFDAFVWLLFDKDSNNRTDFQIKTVDENGKELHGLEHEVASTLSVDGTLIELKKVHMEKWTKKRGGAKKIFSGHTTDYYINGVPSKKKEYNDKVQSLVDEDIFKLLTSPSFFNEQLHWSKRRELLLEISGDISDADVISSSKDLAPLLDIIANRSIEEHKQMILPRMKKINEELERIPVRIDEVQRSMADIEELDKDELEVALSAKKKEIEEKEAQKQRMVNGSEVMELKMDIREIQTQLQEANQTHREEQNKELDDVKKKYRTQTDVVQELERAIKNHQFSINSKNEFLQSNAQDREELRKEWHLINNETFDEHQKTCPTCNQELPELEIDKAIATFNEKKANQLTKINEKGKGLKKKADDISAELKELTEQVEVNKAELETEKEALEALRITKEKLEGAITPFEQTEQYQSFLGKISTLQDQIDTAETNSKEATKEIEDQIAVFKNQLSEIQNELYKFEQVKKSEERIDELEKEERKLAKELEKLEHQLFLLEQFIQLKVKLLEGRINDKFQFATFKLFEEQVNGGIKETCETLYKGVPYSKGLNNASKINIGLDIINTLSKHYGVSAPIFIDNSEAVTKLLDIDSQTISLIVSGDDKKLRVAPKGELAHV